MFALSEGLLLILATIIFAIGVFLGVLLLELISWLGRPKTESNLYKLETYECGELPIGGRKLPISFQYYKCAVAFTAIDIFSMFFIIMAYVLDLLTLEAVGLFVLLVIALVFFVYKKSC